MYASFPELSLSRSPADEALYPLLVLLQASSLVLQIQIEDPDMRTLLLAGSALLCSVTLLVGALAARVWTKDSCVALCVDKGMLLAYACLF